MCYNLVPCLSSSSNIGEFSKDVRLLAALEEAENDGDKLLDAARRLAGAFSELLNAAQPGSNEVSALISRFHRYNTVTTMKCFSIMVLSFR